MQHPLLPLQCHSAGSTCCSALPLHAGSNVCPRVGAVCGACPRAASRRPCQIQCPLQTSRVLHIVLALAGLKQVYAEMGAACSMLLEQPEQALHGHAGPAGTTHMIPVGPLETQRQHRGLDARAPQAISLTYLL